MISFEKSDKPSHGTKIWPTLETISAGNYTLDEVVSVTLSSCQLAQNLQALTPKMGEKGRLEETLLQYRDRH